MIRERKDSKGRILLTGESQLKNGSYTYRYTDRDATLMSRLSFSSSVNACKYLTA